MFEAQDYKSIIKKRVRDLKKEQTNFSLRKLAHSVPMQYTYLSKILNDDAVHLSEDHCFRIARLLDLDPFDTDLLLLLRAIQSTSDAERRSHLKNKLDSLKKQKTLRAKEIEDNHNRLNAEANFLLDPLSTITQLALHIPRYQRTPILLCAELNISETRLKRILSNLEKCNHLTLDPEDPLRIKDFKPSSLHFSKSHHLVRVHQALLKSSIPSRLQVTEEKDKKSFIATVTMSELDFLRVVEEYNQFINRIEKIVEKSSNEAVYQLNFDLFKWL